MNVLWPAASRTPCLNPRTILQTYREFDSLAARLAQRSIRPYHISSNPVRWRENALWKSVAPKKIPWDSKIPGVQVHMRYFASEKRLRVVTKFEDLPKSYNDNRGLAYRATPLTKEETIAIFGNIVTPDTANRVLRVLHGRRVAGTLDDPALSNVNQYEQKMWAQGLAWLRKNVPVDEIQSAGMRAELELAEMNAEVIADAERIGLYTPNSGYKRDEVYGRSGLAEIKKQKEAEWKRKQEIQESLEKTQADEVRENTGGALETLGARGKVELRRPGENPKLKYYLERAKVLPDEPPKMSSFARLWRPALVTLGVILGSCVFAQVYTPPKNSARLWPDIPPSAATIIGIICVNALVLLAWRMPPMFRMLNMYFMVVPGYPRAMSLVGNIFSHQTVGHFGMNMLVLWFLGVRLHEEVGRGNFMAIYLSTGVFGSFVSLCSWVLRNNFISSSMGASGAVTGVLAAYLLLNGSEKVTFFGVFPPEGWPSVSAMSLLAFLIGLEIFTLNRRVPIITVDHWAHLGGYGSGIAAGLALKNRADQRRRAELERRKNLGIIDRIREGRV